jgi:hypothetical protein
MNKPKYAVMGTQVISLDISLSRVEVNELCYPDGNEERYRMHVFPYVVCDCADEDKPIQRAIDEAMAIRNALNGAI